MSQDSPSRKTHRRRRKKSGPDVENLIRIGGLVVSGGGLLLAGILFLCNIQVTSLVWLLCCFGGAFCIVCSAYDVDFFFEHHKAYFVVSMLGRTGARIAYAIFGCILAGLGGIFLLSNAFVNRFGATQASPPPGRVDEWSPYVGFSTQTHKLSNDASICALLMSKVDTVAAAEFNAHLVSERVNKVEADYKEWLEFEIPAPEREKYAAKHGLYENLQKMRNEIKRIMNDPGMAEVYRRHKVPH
jgi:hypothetical protein